MHIHTVSRSGEELELRDTIKGEGDNIHTHSYNIQSLL